MIGFNGGLIGGFRDTAEVASAPGVWTANEQVVARRRGQWIKIADPFFSNVSLLLPGDGANGSTSIIDRSPSPKTVTAFGNAQISTAQSRFGGSSLAFDGNTDYCLISSTNDLVLSANFTIDVWVYFNAFSSTMTVVQTPWDGNGGGFALWHHNSYSTKISVWMESCYYSVAPQISAKNFSRKKWQYVSVQKSRKIFSLWLNGVKEDERSAAISISRQISAIGAYQAPSNPTYPLSMNGFIDDLRITKGVARYTANFTPPTAPHPLF